MKAGEALEKTYRNEVDCWTRLELIARAQIEKLRQLEIQLKTKISIMNFEEKWIKKGL
jgi:hypothetical protein